MKKSHPIRRVVLAGAATVSGIVLLLSLKPASDPAAASAGGAAPQRSASGQQAPQGGAGAVQDGGTVTGTAVKTRYGPVQVRLTVSGGKVTGAEAVRAPAGGRSDRITADAVPKLNREAVAAQSAEIDAVSGATYTSRGYKESLQSALDKVGAGGGGSAASQGAGASQEAEGTQEPGGAQGSGGARSSGGTGSRTLTGDVFKTQYGPVQVRITLRDGRITSAAAVQSPSGGRSSQVSADAVPKLNREAVEADSADIDVVSGATYTSRGYEESLQSALDRAGG
ncbi:FMN-binding protein [Streptomyces minutiscleroticus]|uniref:FMN-binding protein n=1 Tax=Streptomyces minutiscleroticus TaxID=68238 RepID=A0A918NS20_9ACTN|nr:FMN-binding protein [Streptomyces minutiscleroticus]GGX91289.1 FMN-binding protein [Streptomyces minutiscleroticus]